LQGGGPVARLPFFLKAPAVRRRGGHCVRDRFDVRFSEVAPFEHVQTLGRRLQDAILLLLGEAEGVEFGLGGFQQVGDFCDGVSRFAQPPVEAGRANFGHCELFVEVDKAHRLPARVGHDLGLVLRHGFQILFEPPLANRASRAQQGALGLDFLQGNRQRPSQAPHRNALRSPPYRRQQRQQQQRGDEKSQNEIHRLFDHRPSPLVSVGRDLWKSGSREPAPSSRERRRVSLVGALSKNPHIDKICPPKRSCQRIRGPTFGDP